jgi:outer membrane immunogenic protein
MKSLTRLFVAFCACSALELIAYAGPEPLPSGKEMKEVAPAPPPSCCDWQGFYIGLNVGGQFGHSEDKDLDDFYFVDRPWGYSESGFVGGGQIGYNFQWRWLVVGPEIDLGYMNLNGRGAETGTERNPAYGESDSDFYATFRGRIGVALDCWLFYATGGGIGVNYYTRYAYPDYPNPPLSFFAHRQDFDLGYTVGGGIERKIGCRWSIKVEYLYFNLDAQTFSGFDSHFRDTLGFNAETAGHIVRAGLNFHF